MSEDPTGFLAGDADLYRYVGNDPTNATDPTGLAEVINHLQVDSGRLGIKLNSDPKKAGEINKGTVSYALGRKAGDLSDGLYLQYDGPDAKDIFFLQFVAVRAYVTKGGKKVRDVNDLPVYQEKDSTIPFVKNGVMIGGKDNALTYYVDAVGPSGLMGVPYKTRSTLGGITGKGAPWSFDAPTLPRSVSIQYGNAVDAGKYKLAKDETLVFELVFHTYIVKRNNLTFTALARVDWTASAKLYYAKKIVFGKDFYNWASSITNPTYGGFATGAGANYDSLQKAFQSNLKLYPDADKYTFAK